MRKINFFHRLKLSTRSQGLIMLILITLLVLGLAASRTQAALLENPVQALASAAIAENVFGVEITPLDDSGGLSEITTTQTKWVKGIDILWSEVEPTPGNYEWSILQDSVVEFNNAIQANLTPIVVIRNAPEFARLVSGLDCGPIDPDFYTHFGNFILELTSNGESPFNGKDLPYISIWNEPDIDPDYPDTFSGSFGGCWGDIDKPYFGGESYGNMLKTIYPIVTTDSPNTKIIAGELLLDCDPDNPPETFPGSGEYKDCSAALFLEGILVAGDSNYDYFDGISYHAYDYYQGDFGQYANTNWHSSWDTTGPVLVPKLQYINDLFDEYGVTNKFIMNTEFALLCDTCGEDGDFEVTKASFLVQAYARAIANGLEANIWFDVTGTWGRNNGLLKRDLTKLPAFYTYQFASSKLNGITQFSEITQFDGVTGYEFRGAPCEGDTDCNVWILWSLDGADHTVSLPAVPLAVQDMYGNQDAISQTLTVSLTPLYIDMPTIYPRISLPILTNCASFINNLVVDGGFDCGSEIWQIYDEFLPVSLIGSSQYNPTDGTTETSIPLGTASALLGDPTLPCLSDELPPNPDDYAGIDQQIVIPGASEITLSFSYIIYSQDYSSSGGFDRFEVYIDDQYIWGDGNENNVLGCGWYRIPGPYNPRHLDPSGQWAKATIDISSYAGQTINLSFRNYLRYDQWFNTYTYLDNVLITPE